jgi:hypothetical protein
MLQQVVPAVRTVLYRVKPKPSINYKTNESNIQTINNDNTAFSPTSFCQCAARTARYTRTKFIRAWEKLIDVLIPFRNTQQFIKLGT